MRISVLAVLAAVIGVPAVAGPPRDGAPSFLERDVLAELNEVRADPRGMAQSLRYYREQFEGRIVHDRGDPVGVWTHEGVAAVDEAIRFLERQVPRPPLDDAPTLRRAAAELVAMSGSAGTTGHVAAGRSPGQRVRAQGGGGYVSEVISYGQDRAEAVVRQFVIDDGMPSRGHRALIFSDNFRYAGVSCGAHARWRTMCVVDLSATPTGEPVVPGAVASAR